MDAAGLGRSGRKARPGRPDPRLPAAECDSEDAASVSRRVRDERRLVGDGLMLVLDTGPSLHEGIGAEVPSSTGAMVGSGATSQ